MTTPSTAASSRAVSDGGRPAPRRRDAVGTRQLLLDAARRRFAGNGYTTTTLRDIADEVGVNVALISRYFTSKEGLFEACLVGAVDAVERTVVEDVGGEQLAINIARHLAGASAGSQPTQLLLLLRSSGDDKADQIRVDILRSFAERLASVAGWRPGDPDGGRIMLNAQVVLAAALGIALLRSSIPLTPLDTADETMLAAPLGALIETLLPHA